MIWAILASAGWLLAEGTGVMFFLIGGAIIYIIGSVILNVLKN